MPASPDAVRDEVRAWLGAHPRDGLDRRAWLEQVVDAGWAAPTWPTDWFGRAWPKDLGRAVADAFAEAGAPGAGQDESNLWANTALAFGTDDLKHRFLRPLLTGGMAFCLLYSEPGAGSDLAAVQTRADRDGDEWVINGHKVWTSGAREAEYGMLVARTDWDVPKHHGLTFFFFPMRQPGVEVRPLKQITGESHFNEVFITDARVDDANRVGDLNDGWRVLQTALFYERALMSAADRSPRRAGRPDDRSETEHGLWAPSRDLLALARRLGRSGDPVVRQALMRLYSLRLVNRWNGQRALAALQQGTSSPLSSLGKLAMSRILHEGAAVHAHLLGPEALLAGDDHPDGEAANFEALNAYFTSIGGGTDQIQRNIIGERILGLPKEPDVDRDLPFRDVPKAQVAR
jgi:alkylation response protein AidB-like acyl-CoA dehydrogenase